MISDQYVWLVWSISFLIPWFMIYLLYPKVRQQMFKGSIYTAPFSLTEPLFVPEYWNPPTLFHLAQRTGLTKPPFYCSRWAASSQFRVAFFHINHF